MANILRSAKSANEWGNNELEAYNIVIQNAPVPAFFATQNLPPSPIAGTTVWNVERETPDTELSELESDFFFYMKAVEETESLESAVDDFAYFLLRMLGFTSKSRKIRQRPPMHFVMCGKRVDACADVTLVDGKSYLLLVQEDKRHRSSENPDAQLIAETIAAFYENYERRKRVGLPTPKEQVVLGVTMVGTAPTFFRVRVTERLLRALERGSYPDEETVVLKFVPPVPNIDDYLSFGMRPLENRRIVLQCFEGLKPLIVESHRLSLKHPARLPCPS